MPLSHLGIKTGEASSPIKSRRPLDSGGTVVDGSVGCSNGGRRGGGASLAGNTRNARSRSLFGDVVSGRSTDIAAVSSEEHCLNDQVEEDEEAG